MSFFTALNANVMRMGRPERMPEIDTTMPPHTEPDFVRQLGGGITIQLKDLGDSGALGGLLGYRGSQVLLYIREKGNQIESIRKDPCTGPKYHVANCETLKWMKSKNLFGRYAVTNDVTGDFLLVDSEQNRTREVHARLNVCKNCLDFLNYQGYHTDNMSKRQAIFDRFDLPTLFTTYSTLFEFLPTGVNMWKSGDRNSWAPRPEGAPASERCESCDVRLPGDSFLIGVPAGEAGKDGRIVCADCRRKPPNSETVHVSAAVMKRIQHERPGTNGITWQEAYRFADCAFTGLMRLYERQGYDAPEPGLDIVDDQGAVSVQLGLAWHRSKHAVTLRESEAVAARAQGWKALALEAALLDAREDG